MDPFLDMLLKGGLSLTAIAAMVWLTAKAIGTWISNKMATMEANLAAAHVEAQAACRAENAALTKRLETVEARADKQAEAERKRDGEERVVMLRSIDTCARTNEASTKLMLRLVDKLDLTPPEGLPAQKKES